MTLPRLYVIADRETLDARRMSVEWFAHELADAGVSLLQYRDKRGSPQQVLEAAATLSGVFRDTGCELVMNDRADLAILAGWRAVHVGQGDLPPEAVRGLLGRSGMVGVSTHTDEQVREAAASTADYIAVGPVFATGSKRDAEPVIGLEGLRRARKLTGKPLVAIGGISAATARSVLEAGADMVAVIGAVLVGGDRPRNTAARLMELLR